MDTGEDLLTETPEKVTEEVITNNSGQPMGTKRPAPDESEDLIFRIFIS